MDGHQYKRAIAAYIHHNYASHGLVLYLEVPLGKTIIGKKRKIDVFVLRPSDQKALALECKYQEGQGTTDEKIHYALADLASLWVPSCLVYAGRGWSTGVLHTLEAARLAAHCSPDLKTYARSNATRELDDVLATTFGLWELVLARQRRFAGR